MRNKEMNKSEKFWDKRAVEYDQNEKKWSETYNKAIENTTKYLKKEDTVLEMGCGSGIMTMQLANLVKEIHAFDISSKMIESADQRAKGNNIENIQYSQNTIFDERFKKGTYDVILAFNVLHLLDDTPEVMQRINELLKPRGIFISETASLGETKAFLSSMISLFSKMRILPKVSKLKYSDLENLITKVELEILETEILGEGVTTYYIAARKP